ncbi:MAG: class I SAM-dependent methyltransferase [Pyrinomonadaceae bacterium]
MHNPKALSIGLAGKILSNLLPARLMRSKRLFHLWEAKGYHVTPVNFYQPIPDTRDFPEDIFLRESILPGIELNEPAQLALLHEFNSRYRSEYCEFSYGSSKDKREFFFENGVFETVDAEILHCMVRQCKPRRVIEIGAGFSTLITASAIRRNIADDPSYRCDLICVEPYPKAWIAEIPEVNSLIQSKVESVSLETFGRLESNDILFIDSSHVVNIRNDVCFEYLEILPRLKEGVLVHVHDIVLPRMYCEYWFDQKFFWNEQYLLQAFLAFNTRFQIRWAGNLMHLRYPNELALAFPSYSRFKNNIDQRKRQQGHKSFWIQRMTIK